MVNTCQPSTCRPVDLSTRRPVNPSTCRPVDLSTRRPVNPSTCRPVDLSTRRPVDPSTCRPVNPSIHRPVNPSTYQIKIFVLFQQNRLHKIKSRTSFNVSGVTTTFLCNVQAQLMDIKESCYGVIQLYSYSRSAY